MSYLADIKNEQELFKVAIDFVLKNEGVFSNNKNDKGGITKYGISKKSYPHIDIANLTLDEAITIYKKDFWDPYPYKKIINSAIAVKIFDLAINMGPKKAHLLLQKSLNFLGTWVTQDGIIGPATLEATNQANSDLLLKAIKLAAEIRYNEIIKINPTQSVFLKGWLKRAYL